MYKRQEAGRRAYFVVTGIELPNTLTHDEIKAYSHALPEEQWKRCHELDVYKRQHQGYSQLR